MAVTGTLSLVGAPVARPLAHSEREHRGIEVAPGAPVRTGVAMRSGRCCAKARGWQRSSVMRGMRGHLALPFASRFRHLSTSATARAFRTNHPPPPTHPTGEGGGAEPLALTSVVRTAPATAFLASASPLRCSRTGPRKSFRALGRGVSMGAWLEGGGGQQWICGGPGSN